MMSRSSFLAGLSRLALLSALAGCGGDGSGEPAPEAEASIRTRAYVVTACHEGAGRTFEQSLQIRRGDRAPVTVMEIPTFHLPPLGLCRLYGQFRVGTASVAVGGFQRN